MSPKNLISSFPSPKDINIYELPNGIKIISRQNFSSPSVSIKGYLQTGSMDDPDNLLGLASFTSTALSAGTKYRDFTTLHNTIESLGANLSIGNGVVTTNFSIQCLAEDFSQMVGLLGEVLRFPAFPDKQFKRIKSQFLTMLAIMAQDTSEMAALTFDKMIFKDHPYGRPEDGTKKSIQAIQVENLQDFHQKYYGPQGVVIVVVGAVKTDVAIKVISQNLEDWINPYYQLPKPIPQANPVIKNFRRHVTIPDKSQSDIVMGTLGPTRKSEDFYPCALGNDILGVFGMMGRIGSKVREKSGLAYYAQSSLSASSGPGSWEFVAGVNPKNIEKVICIIQDEIKRYLNEKVSIDELEDTKSFLIGHLPITLESNSGVAMSLLNMERFDLGLDYLQKYPEIIMSITPEDILERSQKYLSHDKMIIATAGRRIK